MQSATNTSTAADLLKQGAGSSRLLPVSRDPSHKSCSCSSHMWPAETAQASYIFFFQHWPLRTYVNIKVFHLSNQPACNVLYLNSVETESLTGPEAVSKATKCTLALSPRPVATVVHFKVSSQGITLTDSKRRYLLDTRVFLLGRASHFNAAGVTWSCGKIVKSCVWHIMTHCVH